MNVSVPSPLPGGMGGEEGGGVKLSMTAGDFVALYSPISGARGPAFRTFDCVVTCFFIDTGDDLIDYIQTIDGLLAEVRTHTRTHIHIHLHVHTYRRILLTVALYPAP
jgi:hypothetical protein